MELLIAERMFKGGITDNVKVCMMLGDQESIRTEAGVE